MINNLTLIYADNSQIEMITKYRMKLWDDAGKFKSKEEFNFIYNLNKEYFENQFNDNNIIIPMYLDESNRIAAIGIGVIIQKPIVNYENIGLEGFIFNMYTEQNYRNKGLASAIFKEIEMFFEKKNVYKIYLDSNEKSINLYKKMGMNNNKFYLEKMAMKWN